MVENEELAHEAVALANQIEAILTGHQTVAVYLALSMILGASAARADRPNFTGMMRLVEQGARTHFEDRMMEKRHNG